MMSKVAYDDRQFAVYARGRALTPVVLARWMKVFADHGQELMSASVAGNAGI